MMWSLLHPIWVTGLPWERMNNRQSELSTRSIHSPSPPRSKTMSSPLSSPPTWADLDVNAPFNTLSTYITDVRSHLARKDEVVASLQNPMLPTVLSDLYTTHPAGMSSRILMRLNTEGLASRFTHVFALLLFFGSEKQETRLRPGVEPELPLFFPGGRVPPADLPFPSGFLETVIIPRVHMALFRLHYAFFRSLILGASVFASAVMNDDANDSSEAQFRRTLLQFGVPGVLQACHAFLQVPVAWSMYVDAINMRVASDPVVLEGIANILRLALWFHTRPIAEQEKMKTYCKGSSVPAASDDGSTQYRLDRFVVSTVCTLSFPFSLNASAWIKYQKEHYVPESREPFTRSKVSKLLQQALDIWENPGDLSDRDNLALYDVLPNIVTLASLVLELEAVYEELDGASTIDVTFRPLRSTEHADLEPILSRITRKNYNGSVLDRKRLLVDYCDNCNSTQNLKRCSRCLVARFCSVECQRAARVEHKKVCFDGKAARSEGITLEQLAMPEVPIPVLPPD